MIKQFTLSDINWTQSTNGKLSVFHAIVTDNNKFLTQRHLNRLLVKGYPIHLNDDKIPMSRIRAIVNGIENRRAVVQIQANYCAGVGEVGVLVRTYKSMKDFRNGITYDFA